MRTALAPKQNSALISSQKAIGRVGTLGGLTYQNPSSVPVKFGLMLTSKKTQHGEGNGEKRASQKGGEMAHLPTPVLLYKEMGG